MRLRRFFGACAALIALGTALTAPGAHARFDPARALVEPDVVARRFPDPEVAYDTPGFRPGRTDFTSHDELIAWVEALQKDTGGFALRVIGRSGQGRPIPLLVFAIAGDTTGEAMQAAGRPTVLIVAQQHGNEPAGSEASLVIARRLASGDLRPLLARINVLIVPHANPDGAEAFVRDTASKIDMNRDHLLLRTPEARAIARIAREYRPDVVVDAHEFTVLDRWVTKFGGAMRYDALVQYATVGNLPAPIARASERPFREAIVGALEREGTSRRTGTSPPRLARPTPPSRWAACSPTRGETSADCAMRSASCWRRVGSASVAPTSSGACARTS